MRVLILGEIVARAGYTAVKRALKSVENIDLTIANAEGMANGWGCGKVNAINLLKAGVDIITGGEKLFFKPDMQAFITETSKVIRPYNYPLADSIGHGVKYTKVGEASVAVINILSQNGIKPILNNPFVAIDYPIKKAKETCPVVIVIFHSAASAEKQTMFHYLDGKVSAVIGTHTKVMTNDAKVSKNHTAYITDNGRCGSTLSVGGLDAETEIKKLRSNLPLRSKECFDKTELQGVIVEINDKGEALSIEKVKIPVEIDKSEFVKDTKEKTEEP